jgi:putative molybdopterin biosynthesis protein
MSTVYTPQEVADKLRVHRFTIYRAIRGGRLDALHIGNQIRIPHESLKAFTQTQPRPKARRKVEA